MKPTFFSNQSEFRKWLNINHKKETELWVGYYKVGSGKPSMTWPQSVDEALCFGWIDGIRQSVDKESYCIRFTPRRPTSNWSAVNIKKVETLVKQGLMRSAGIEAFKNRDEEKVNRYSFETRHSKLPIKLEKKFKAHKAAWDFFTKQASSYKKTVLYWIMVAKHEETQLARLTKTIAASEKQKRLWDRTDKS